MKKKMMGMLVLLVFVGVIGAMPVMAAKITAPDGYVFTTDDENGYFQIGDAEALTEFSKYVNFDGNETNFNRNAVLTADIKLNEALNNNPRTDWRTWGGSFVPGELVSWKPIGNTTNPHFGIFDGGGHTISGIYINTNTNGQGLFGQCAEGSNIKNLKITESYLKGADYTGGIAGSSGGTITNCEVAATVVGRNNVGGVVGQLDGIISGSSFIGSSFRGSVEGANKVGAIAGEVAGSISNCYNTGSVEGTNMVGAIAGEVAGSISNCYNTGSANGLYYGVGGIAGKNTGSVTNCYHINYVRALESTMGAIVGANEGRVANCYYWTKSAFYGKSGEVIYAYGIGNTTADVVGQTEVKTHAAFSSGEVAWRLQNGQTDPVVPVWGQHLDSNFRPLLTTTDKICQVTFQAGNGIAAESKVYVNQNGKVTPPLPAPGYLWQDGNQGVFTADSTITGDVSVRCGIASLPTATATYGSSTKLGDIMFSGGSVVTEGWSWNEADKETVLAVGNSTAYPATYTPADGAFAIEPILITPVITPRSLKAAEVTISQPVNASYTGAAIKPLITVSDSAAAITDDDYTISYTNNTSPGTATVTITGQGNYQGVVTRNFTITSSGDGEYTPLGVRYLTHIQDYGWETDWVTAGALSGTSGQSKRLEALKVELTGDLPAGASIETAVHVQNRGDLGPFAMGSAAGTSGLGLRLENITLTLTNLPGYSLRYNVHVQNQGWLRDEADSSSWFSSGEVAGTAGQCLRLEGIRMVLVKEE